MDWELLSLKLKEYEAVGSRAPGATPIPQELQALTSLIAHLKCQCERLELGKAHDRVLRFENTVENGLCTNSIIFNELTQLHGVMKLELDERTLTFIPEDRTTFFEKDNLFGDEVSKQFPSAAADIKAAGNCMASVLDTAAVFHLTRAAEIGLFSLARHLNIKKVKDGTAIKLATWGQIIESIDKHIQDKLLTTKGRRTAKKQTQLHFYQGISRVFSEIKDLWRNPVSHSGKTYDYNKAIVVYGHIKHLMEQLAEKVKENA